MRYFVSFAYNGTNYHGSQSQPNGLTVQSVMEEAFATILRTPVPLTFAGRTDAGVHAEHMVAHFDAEQPIPANLAPRLNNLLPPDIAIHDIRSVINDAHARFDALTRTYHYRITTRKDPFSAQTRTRVGAVLDINRLNQATSCLLGTQDFSSFCRAHTDAKTTICTVTDAQWVVENEYESYFTITANRFLRNMVRAIVGTLFEVGRGKMTIDQFAEVIAAHDRCQAGHSAPAEGLSLVQITYPEMIYHPNL